MHPTDNSSHRAGLQIARAAAAAGGVGSGEPKLFVAVQSKPNETKRVAQFREICRKIAEWEPLNPAEAVLAADYGLSLSDIPTVGNRQFAGGVVGTISDVKMQDGVACAQIKMAESDVDPLKGFTILPDTDGDLWEDDGA